MHSKRRSASATGKPTKQEGTHARKQELPTQAKQLARPPAKNQYLNVNDAPAPKHLASLAPPCTLHLHKSLALLLLRGTNLLLLPGEKLLVEVHRASDGCGNLRITRGLRLIPAPMPIASLGELMPDAVASLIEIEQAVIPL